MRIFVSTGEASGDKHAAKVVKTLKNLGKYQFFGIGGPALKEAGTSLIFPYDKISIIGFQEALLRFPTLKDHFVLAVRKASQSDGVILVDNPGFNLKLAKHLSTKEIPVIYYIVPQVWAWGRWRIKTLKRFVDLALTILPFEEKLLERFGIRASFVGHPILDEIPLDEREKLPPWDQIRIGFLPGSRSDEIRRLLPRMARIMEEIGRLLSRAKFLLSLKKDHPLAAELQRKGVEIKRGPAHEVILNSHILVVASGTVSLEAGLFLRPHIVLYALSDLSWIIAKGLAKVSHVSLVNLLLKKEVVGEHIQRIDPKKIALEVRELVEKRDLYESKRRDLEKLHRILGPPGAPGRAAYLIDSLFKGKL